MSEDKLVEEFRLAGRLMALGIRMNPPRLPRSPHGLEVVKREAARDPRIRRALEASVAETERARQLKPKTLIRTVSGPITIR